MRELMPVFMVCAVGYLLIVAIAAITLVNISSELRQIREILSRRTN